MRWVYGRSTFVRYVITKFSCFHRIPSYLSNGAPPRALGAREVRYKLRVVINLYNSVRNTNTDQKIAEVLHSLSYIFYHFHGWHVDAYLNNNKH